MGSLWQNAPIVFVQIPCCPDCGATEYKRLRSFDGGDSSKSQKRICRGCGLAHLVVFERFSPDRGDFESESGTITT
jgi:hypothetical protein